MTSDDYLRTYGECISITNIRLSLVPLLLGDRKANAQQAGNSTCSPRLKYHQRTQQCALDLLLANIATVFALIRSLADQMRRSSAERKHIHQTLSSGSRGEPQNVFVDKSISGVFYRWQAMPRNPSQPANPQAGTWRNGETVNRRDKYKTIELPSQDKYNYK